MKTKKQNLSQIPYYKNVFFPSNHPTNCFSKPSGSVGLFGPRDTSKGRVQSWLLVDNCHAQPEVTQESSSWCIQMWTHCQNRPLLLGHEQLTPNWCFFLGCSTHIPHLILVLTWKFMSCVLSQNYEWDLSEPCTAALMVGIWTTLGRTSTNYNWWTKV